MKLCKTGKCEAATCYKYLRNHQKVTSFSLVGSKAYRFLIFYFRFHAASLYVNLFNMKYS